MFKPGHYKERAMPYHEGMVIFILSVTGILGLQG